MAETLYPGFERPAIAGWRVLHFPELDSTNEEARRRAQQGDEGDLALYADRQHAGRGRRGRAWVSGEGNLFLSCLLRPAVGPARAAELSFATALAAHDALSAATGLGPRFQLKWPNDLLLDGAKVAGILLESATGRDGGLEFLVIGIGVNLAAFPAETPYPATSVAATLGRAVAPLDLIAAFLPRLSHWITVWEREGFAGIRDAWAARAAGLGERITVRLAHETLEGVFSGLRLDGALDLRLDSGAVRAVTAGDVFLPGTEGAGR
ncbi:biotin--[acetyl-CoA-carboxylase] ligase [Zavarzinia compransoris]|uniref:biotin--[biotin carboxyl-carrier protein] ligase n=1 Tax=Zavarzinia compransoris TaxID=1264899 RepID=A0A317ECK1_9PROT|nr:biotin--[acetyl-CoA-carboxylase] ligase [Zavarzinia compransoris]PWR23850.1 biotin--[acetyl-CoA-carboxylase] ligase [Zavarzinia compransoris]TDP48087.1 BirA family biotin operon repressor/biotin-[acetyl-CoA-carboxylase] ligase [Zavarzinia compransoris]